MKIGVIGIGVMGDPIARNLKKAGMRVTVHSRTPARCEPLKQLGIEVAGSPAEVMAASDAVILMLPSNVETDQVLGRDAEGRVTLPVEGKTIILMATVAPAYSQALGHALAREGARYVEAPVSGSKTPAQTAQLVVLAAAADAAHIDAVQPVFDAIGKKTVRCGEVPSAMRMKLATNLLLIASFEAITEAVHFAGGMGLDVRQFLDMALAGPLASDVMRTKRPSCWPTTSSRRPPFATCTRTSAWCAKKRRGAGCGCRFRRPTARCSAWRWRRGSRKTMR